MRLTHPFVAVAVAVGAAVLAVGIVIAVRNTGTDVRTGTAVSDTTAGPSGSAPTATDTIKIMPLGASLTYGTNSTDGNGYREELRKLLVDDAGLSVDFVGSVQAGDGADPDNEGHPGLRIDEVADNVDEWLGTYHPDVVLLNAGANDTLQDYRLDTAPDRLRALIDQIIADDPDVTVLFSTLAPTGDSDRNDKVDAFDAQLPAIAQAEAAAGRKVYLVDLNAALTTDDIGEDDVHPTDGGYLKIAAAWYAALKPVLSGDHPAG